MRRLSVIFALTTSLLATPALAADSSTVSIRDPAKFASTLKEMGFSPEPVQRTEKLPLFRVLIGGQPTNIIFGGCTDFVDCRYIIFSSSYSDVPNPPTDWVMRMNDYFDVIKIGIDSDKALYYSATHIIEGVPRATLKEILDSWDKDGTALAEEAIKARLNKK